MASTYRLTVSPIPSHNPKPVSQKTIPPHHIGKPPTHFQNPWPSFKPLGIPTLLHARFLRQKNFVPVPEKRKGLVNIREPDWGAGDDPNGEKLKATWIGHASWMIETAAPAKSQQQNGRDTSRKSRGVRILLDPVFAERTSPFTRVGPKRYSPVPCTVANLPEVDIVAISHNHYDHLDISTIEELYLKQGHIHILCGLGNKSWFLSLGVGIKDEEVTELDWWEGVKITIADVGNVNMTCTPAQHASNRGINPNKTLWCSWVLEEELGDTMATEVVLQTAERTHRKLYFAGDTGYRTVTVPSPTSEEEGSYARCPAFSEIGAVFGSFDLALLPIGLYSPRDVMSAVHCSPEDSVCVHRDINSKKSIGMHYGTVRGGISGQFEDVTEPPKRWREACEKAGLVWDTDAGLCDIGETVIVD